LGKSDWTCAKVILDLGKIEILHPQKHPSPTNMVKNITVFARF